MPASWEGLRSPCDVQKCPVSPTNFNVVRKARQSPSRWQTDLDSLPNFLANACRACACAGQSNKKWWTISSAPRHTGQRGESTLPIRCRKALSGACPVLSCIRTLACTLVRSSVARKKAGEGSLVLILANFRHRGDLAHNYFIIMANVPIDHCLL